ncbi:TMV resistance protein N [Vitis vinifera]|uniref:TMV resistance protein N n=1 Tax=Vitis vinifera TaxID=29760 RepID=A0A438DTA9_VITVI|nr:TMV resistance protein N [Vitis vinifera]
MASSSTHRASSSTTSISRNYDVFLSFRGRDTRRNFTDHLYTTLTASGIQTFRDDEELEKGGDIASDLFRAIEESRGSFGDALAYHERDANQEKMEMIQKWRIALREAANLSGCHVNDQSFLRNIRERSKGDILQLQQELLHDMHDLIQLMGWEVIRQECPEDPGRRSRLWDSNAYHVLIGNTGIRAIEGLFLDRCKFNLSQLTTKSFKEMNRLRLLKIHNPRRKIFAIEFSCKEPVELLLRNNNIKQLWRGNKLHDKLRVIDLSYSVHLIRIPDFSSVPNLEILTLEGCVNLELLPRGIYKWKHLQTLSCNGCSKLERFPEIKGNMRELRVLDLSGTAIMDLPSSITHLNGLQTLLLKVCSKLHKIPSHICHLSSLKVLDLGHCNIMEGGIPSDICHLSSLQKLNLERGHFSSIPTTINQLSRLEVLNLSHCNNLEQIPELPSRLRLLDAHGSNRTSSRAPFLPLHSLVNCFSWAQDIPEKESAHGSENESDNKSGMNLLITGDKSVDGIVDFPFFQSNCFCYKEDKDEDNESGSGETLVPVFKYEKTMEVNRCGFHLIYSEDLHQSHPLTTQTKGADVRICNECQCDGARRKPCFGCSDMNEVPIIENPLELDRLCLLGCKNLTSLPSGICNFKSLATLCCSGCTQLESFPDILQDMENLRNLYLDRTAIKEIPSSIERLRGLQHLTLINCINLVKSSR